MGLAQRAEIEKIRSYSNNDISSKEVAARLANDRIGASAKESLQRTVIKCAPLLTAHCCCSLLSWVTVRDS